MSGPTVVVGWGLANAALMFMSLGFGPLDQGIPLYLFASSNGLLLLIGAVAWLVLRRHERWAAATPALTRSTDALMVGIAVGFVGLGLAYRPWLIIGAGYPVLILIAHAVDHLLASRVAPPAPAEEPG